jgi:hypothetical protein
MADIFISHSSGDNEVAAAIGERIRRERPSWSFSMKRTIFAPDNAGRSACARS